MKKALLMIGCVVLAGVLAIAAYLGSTVFISYFIVYVNLARHPEWSGARVVIHQVALQPPAPTPGAIQPDTSAEPPPSFFVDPENYRTEDNWIASSISREIAAMASMIEQPDQPVPQLKITAEVDPSKSQVDIEIKGFGTGTSDIATSLTPAFAWDPHGYTPLATKLLAVASPAAPGPLGDQSDILVTLQDLTGLNLAKEDVRLSQNLQQNPASIVDHEAAALALTALALRENAGYYNDNRKLLSRATAHLALAEALRGDHPASWPGLIADAALKTLSGRELDALGLVDRLEARPDCPASAKPWFVALRLLAKQDWRVADVSSSSPLLVKIVWFQMLATNLSDMVAIHRLEQVLPNAWEDPPAAIWNVPDWGRAVLSSQMGVSVENGHRFARNNMVRELQELNQVMNVEGGAPPPGPQLADLLAEPENETVSSGAGLKPIVTVIGRGSFQAATRHHLLNTIFPTYYWLANSYGVPAEAEDFHDEVEKNFRGVSGYEFARNAFGLPSDVEATQLYRQWGLQKKSWPVWDAQPSLVEHIPGKQLVDAFYIRAVPFGTVYRILERWPLIRRIGLEKYDADIEQRLRDFEKLPHDEQAANRKTFNASLQDLAPKEPTAFEKQLLQLNPDNFDLALDYVPAEKILPAPEQARFLDYNMRAIYRVESLATDKLNDDDRAKVFRRHAALDPGANFMLASLLRQQGHDDEAAEADRKGVAEAYDQVEMSNSVGPLVDYDMAHGQQEEAEKVAGMAADVGSAWGLRTQMFLFAKLGRFDQAEAVGQSIKDRYGDRDGFYLVQLYVRYRDHFIEKYKEAQGKYLPKGLIQVELASFTSQPTAGCQITSDSPLMKTVGLHQGDVIVALDGYLVESVEAYNFIKELSQDPKMDFVVWRHRDLQYHEIKASLPSRLFNAQLGNFLHP